MDGIVDGYIKKHDKTRYLTLFHFNAKYKGILNRIRNLTM